MTKIRVQTTSGCYTVPDPDDECAWCGDARRQHTETGCRLCGRYPWERGIYACTGFVERDKAAARRRKFMKAAGLLDANSSS